MPAEDEVLLAIYRRMTPAEKLAQVIVLSERMRALYLAGLRLRYPDLPEREIKRLYIEGLTCPQVY